MSTVLVVFRRVLDKIKAFSKRKKLEAKGVEKKAAEAPEKRK